MRPTFDDIYYVTLDVLNIKREVFERAGRSRFSPIMRAKQMMCFIACEMGYTTTFIGKRLNLNHTTVVHHHKSAQDHIDYEQDYAEDINAIYAKLDIPCLFYKKTGWLTRDKEEHGANLLFTVGKKPRRDGIWLTSKDCEMYDLPRQAFPHITWESEPQECEMTLRLK